MSTKERILAIRLMEKIRSNPAYAKTLGVEAVETVIALDHKRNLEKQVEGTD